MTCAQRTDSQTSVYDCAGQRVQTSANNVTRTIVYDIFGQDVADYLGSSVATMERENIYRGGQLLAVYETGASCYKSISDFVAAFYDGVHHTPTTTEFNDKVAALTVAQSQGQGQLIAAAQSLGTTLFNSSEYGSLNTNNAQFVTDLYAAYLGRVPDGPGYDYYTSALASGTSRTTVRNGFAYSPEFQNDVGQLCVSTSSPSADYKYVLSDLQGTTRAVMNNNSTSDTSMVIARHDYLPFGEEIWTGRSSSNAYGKTDAIRLKYGLTERDDATGLDHTWWRKLESFSGRWTTPDPYNGSMAIGDPQSFNRFAYTQNDPVNFIDPSGLDDNPPGGWPTDPSAYGYAYTWTWAPFYPGGSPGQGLHGMLLDVGDFATSLGKIKQKICAAVPSGRTVGASGALGLLGGPVGGGEVVINYNSGQVSAFAFGGAQVGWNGAASGTVSSGFVYGLNDSNSNYSGGFTGVSGAAAVGGFVQSSSGGLTNGARGVIPNPRGVTVGGVSAGASLLGGVKFAGTVTHYTQPLQLGRWGGLIGLSPLDAPFYSARQLCK